MSQIFSSYLNLEKKIKNLRDKYNLSQRDLAKKIGISQPHLAKIETGANVSEKTMEKLLSFFQADSKYLLSGNEESDKSKLFQLTGLNISKKLFTTRDEIVKFNLKNTKRIIHIFPEIMDKFKGKTLYAYEMPDESLNQIINPGDIVLVLFENKIKPSKKNNGQILAVEFQGGIKALKYFLYPDEFWDQNTDELDDTQEIYKLKDIKKIIGVAAYIISYRSLLPKAPMGLSISIYNDDSIQTRLEK